MKNILRTFSLSLGLLLMTGLSLPGLAAAHVLKEDNGISGVLHIPPEDNPQAGQPTELDESFGNEANTFNLTDCNCQIIVKHANQTVQTVTPEPYANGATLDSKATVRFPVAGVYDVIVKGSAKNGAFNTFQLDYLVRVTSSASTAAASNNSASIGVISAGSLIILVMFAYSAIKGGRRYQSKPIQPKSSNKSRRKQ